MRRVWLADLLILHAGAGAVITAIRAGKVPIVAARRACYGEHIDDHQLEFAHALAETGRAIVVDDMDGLPAAIEQAMSRQDVEHMSRTPPAMVSMIESVLNHYAKSFRNTD